MRDNGDLAHRVCVRAVSGDQCVTQFVIGNASLLNFGQPAALPFSLTFATEA
jgi:hypothetical protein